MRSPSWSARPRPTRTCSDSETEDEFGGLPSVVANSGRAESVHSSYFSDFDAHLARFLATRRAEREAEEQMREEERQHEIEMENLRREGAELDQKLHAVRLAVADA